MGARWYGFSPVKIEKGSGIKFADMFHGHNERVPVAGLAWGVEVLDAVVREICGACPTWVYLAWGVEVLDAVVREICGL